MPVMCMTSAPHSAVPKPCRLSLITRKLDKFLAYICTITLIIITPGYTHLRFNPGGGVPLPHAASALRGRNPLPCSSSHARGARPLLALSRGHSQPHAPASPGMAFGAACPAPHKRAHPPLHRELPDTNPRRAAKALRSTPELSHRRWSSCPKQRPCRCEIRRGPLPVRRARPCRHGRPHGRQSLLVHRHGRQTLPGLHHGL